MTSKTSFDAYFSKFLTRALHSDAHEISVPWPVAWESFESTSEKQWLIETRRFVSSAGDEYVRQLRLHTAALSVELADVAESVDVNRPGFVGGSNT
jgi:hypothetical protein